MLGFNEGPAEAGPARNAALFVCDSVTLFASGSEAEPVTETALFSVPLTVAGRVMTGAWLPVVIVSAVVAVDVPAVGALLSTAVQLIVKLPAAAGVPVSVMLGFKDGPLELEAGKNGALFVCDKVTFWASGSVAEPVTETERPVAPLCVAGAVMTGFRFRFAIVRAVVAAAVPADASVALQLTVYAPYRANDAVPGRAMLGFNAGAAGAAPERTAARVGCDSATFSASGSDAEPVIETAEFSVPLTVAGAVMTGFRFRFAIVRAVEAVALPAVGLLLSTAVQLTV